MTTLNLQLPRDGVLEDCFWWFGGFLVALVDFGPDYSLLSVMMKGGGKGGGTKELGESSK